MNNLTTFLAVWGALLSTALAGWTIFRDLRDKGKLQLDATIGNIVPGDDKRDFLLLTITNVGRRPILLKSWYLKFNKGSTHPLAFILADNLPKMLKEGEFLTVKTHELQHLVKTEKILVCDSNGKQWKVPKKSLRTAIQD